MLKNCGKGSEGGLATGWLCVIFIVLLGVGVTGGLMFWAYLMMEFMAFLPIPPTTY